MTDPASSSMTTPAIPGVEFGRGADGLLVARVGDHAFAMVPGRKGGHFLSTAWRLSRPIAEWTQADFYGLSGVLADEQAFRTHIAEHALHQQQRAALGRRQTVSHAYTPWGPSQGATVYADGILCHSTAGHGGFQLTPDRNALVHPTLRAADGFYEEDCDWAAVAQAFPELFTDHERSAADDTIRNWHPAAWEAIHGAILDPGQSREKDRLAFEERHAADWIVVSALHSDQAPGFTEVVATIGGKRGVGAVSRRFLVPRDEYGIDGGRFGFVIDEARHRLYDGPSSFVGGAG